MIAKKNLIWRLRKAIFGCFFGIIALFGLVTPLMSSGVAFAEGAPEANTAVEAGKTEAAQVQAGDAQTEEDVITKTLKPNTGSASCKDSLGQLAWFVCPETNTVAEAVDWLYGKTKEILLIDPVEAKDGKPIYEIWKYFRGATNIVFIIFLLVVIYSQVTGMGISNYGIKKVLPKLIVTAILVNLSFQICAIAVDISNILGQSLKGLFDNIQYATMGNIEVSEEAVSSLSEIYAALAGGEAIAITGAVISFETGTIWMLIPTVLTAVVAVCVGLLTIAMRQAVVSLLIMISPLAFVAYILPNTEQWFKKWKQLFMRMLVFYPMFSALFGASSFAGWAIIASAKDGFWLILGYAVQILPLFFSVNLMKMSGTFLGTINGKLQSLASRPIAANRAWADSRRQLTKQKSLASKNAYTPSLRLMQFLSNRRISREEEIKEHADLVKLRGMAYNARKNYDANGVPTKEGVHAYEMQARKARYQFAVDRHTNNMNMGLGELKAVKAHASKARKMELEKLDVANVEAFDALKVEKARGERIEYDNAVSFHKRMEDAVNAHFDSLHGNDSKYKRHIIADRDAALARYKTVNEIMEGSAQNTQYAAAYAAHAYDTQAKIISSKFQKYFDLTPPTKDVMYRLNEFSKMTGAGKKASDEIDAIIAGLRVVNQRGDTDLVKSIVDDLTNKNYGGIQLGTHASQALASFLMFEVKDNDPFLRRFGKYINLETANVYNSNNRKEMGVTYDEYVKGYHEEPDGTRMYAKKDMKRLVEGTSLDNVERTAFSNLDESLKKAYGFDPEHPDKEWNVSDWIKKRKEIQTAFEPAFLSASLKWLSGSEQMNSGVKFWTGYELTQKKDEETGKLLLDDDKNPIYEYIPVWKDKKAGFGRRHEDEVRAYFQERTMAYFNDQTTGQVLGMRTDYRDPTVEHLIEEYLGNDPERRQEFEAKEAEIMSRYSDRDPKEANRKRSEDLKKYKQEVAGIQLRQILGRTGKLKQIYRTRTSGTAINAKDWLRRMVLLDNEDALRQEMNKYEDLRQEEQNANKKNSSGNGDSNNGVSGSIYSASDREEYLAQAQKIKDKIMDDEPAVFFEEMRGQFEEWFGVDCLMAKKYDKFYKQNPRSDNIELYKYMRDLLEDPDNYPDA